MGAEPVWCLFRVKPQDSVKVITAFNKAVKQSKISQKLEEYLQNRRCQPPIFNPQFRETLNQFIPQAFASNSDVTDAFDWEDTHNTWHLFFPKAFENLLEGLLNRPNLIISGSRSEAIVDFIISNRVGATQMLYAGLGWSRANRLPGYCGNMFISAE